MSTDKSSESFDTDSTFTKLSLYTDLNARRTLYKQGVSSGRQRLLACFMHSVCVSAVVLWTSFIWDSTLPQRIIESRYFEGSTFPRNTVAVFVSFYFIFL